MSEFVSITEWITKVKYKIDHISKTIAQKKNSSVAKQANINTFLNNPIAWWLNNKQTPPKRIMDTIN